MRLHAVGDVRSPDDLAEVVDDRRRTERPAKRPEIDDLAVLPERGVEDISIQSGPADGLSRVVDPLGEAPWTAKRAEVGRPPAFPERGVGLTVCRLGVADDLAAQVAIAVRVR